MTITADSAASNGRLRASSDIQPPALTPPLVVPLQAPGERSGARAPTATRAHGRAKSEAALRGPDARLMMLQRRACTRAGALAIDAWTLVAEWYRRFGDRRNLHATAHDVLMPASGLGDYLRANGVLRASREAVSGALTVFVLSEGRLLARWSGGLGRRLRGVTLPVTLGLPLGVSLEILPTHTPLPTKIRTEPLDPIEVQHDPERSDVEHVDRTYREVQAAIQAGMNRVAARRQFPVFG